MRLFWPAGAGAARFSRSTSIMLRFAVFLMLIAIVGAGAFVLMEPASVGGPNLLRMSARGYGSWALGLAMGLTVAWLSRFDWIAIARASLHWAVGQRRNAGWFAVGLASMGVLVFF